MAAKKTGIKFDVNTQDTAEHRPMQKSIIIPATAHITNKSEHRRSELSIASDVSRGSEISKASDSSRHSSHRRRRAPSIWGIRGKDLRRRSTFIAPILQPTFQPTYRLEPKSPLIDMYVKQILRNGILKAFGDYKYDIKSIDQKCYRTSILIQKNLESEEYDRYRFIVFIATGEKFYQDLVISTGFLWDKEKDKYFTYLVEKPDFFALGIVYGIYYD